MATDSRSIATSCRCEHGVGEGCVLLHGVPLERAFPGRSYRWLFPTTPPSWSASAPPPPSILQQRPVITESSSQFIPSEGRPGFIINGTGFTLSSGGDNSTFVFLTPVKGNGASTRLPIVFASFSVLVVDIPPGQGGAYDLVILVGGVLSGEPWL